MNTSDLHYDPSVVYRTKKNSSSHSNIRNVNTLIDKLSRKKSFQSKAKTIIHKDFKVISEIGKSFEFRESIEKINSDYLKVHEDIDIQSQNHKSIDTQLSQITSTLLSLCTHLAPLKPMLEKISQNLSTINKLIQTSQLLSFPLIPSRSITSKLKLLSEENVSLHKSNEQLQNDLILLKSTKVFDEYHYSVEKLLNELSFKNQCISRCYQEINDLKLREIHLLKILEKKNFSFSKSISKDKNILNENNKNYKKSSVQIPPLPIC